MFFVITSPYSLEWGNPPSVVCNSDALELMPCALRRTSAQTKTRLRPTWPGRCCRMRSVTPGNFGSCALSSFPVRVDLSGLAASGSRCAPAQRGGVLTGAPTEHRHLAMTDSKTRMRCRWVAVGSGSFSYASAICMVAGAPDKTPVKEAGKHVL